MAAGSKSFSRLISVGASLSVILLAAFVTRLLPLSISRFPFNNDSLTECGIASEIMDNGHLTYSREAPWHGTHSVATPALNVVLAFVSSSLDVSPYDCAQVVGATICVLTVGAIFLVARTISGSHFGGFVAGFMAVMFGTFVFTTGSVWKGALGVGLLAFATITFMQRNDLRYRILCTLTLLTFPLVHHVVAALAMLFFLYLLFWSWFFALSNGAVRRRHFLDLAMISVPVVVTGAYYSYVSLDRLSAYAYPIQIALLVSFFILFALLSVVVLSLRNHSKWTFSPFLGIALILLLSLDYFGYVFPYSASAANAYFFLAIAFAFTFSLSWYGTELILENMPVHRSIQLAFLVAPLTVISFGISGGLTTSSHQIVFRTFDYLYMFIFVGAGAGLAFLMKRRTRLYPIIGVVLAIAMVVSFPFAYDSDRLLGVRHDTQEFEVDALSWAKDNIGAKKVISDERLSYVSWSLDWLVKDAGLPGYMTESNTAILPGWICLVEDSWTTTGVNAYPKGKVIIPKSNYTAIIDAADVVYVGGPLGNSATVFVGSQIGQTALFGSSG